MISLTPFLIVLQLLLPGYAWILASGLHKQISTMEKVVLSFVVSFCFFQPTHRRTNLSDR